MINTRIDGLSYKEIASKLAMNELAVKGDLNKARQNLNKNRLLTNTFNNMTSFCLLLLGALASFIISRMCKSASLYVFLVCVLLLGFVVGTGVKR